MPFWHTKQVPKWVPKRCLNLKKVPKVPNFKAPLSYISHAIVGHFLPYFWYQPFFCHIFDINPYFVIFFLKTGPFCRRDTEPGTMEWLYRRLLHTKNNYCLHLNSLWVWLCNRLFTKWASLSTHLEHIYICLQNVFTNLGYVSTGGNIQMACFTECVTSP